LAAPASKVLLLHARRRRTRFNNKPQRMGSASWKHAKHLVDDLRAGSHASPQTQRPASLRSESKLNSIMEAP
jgi:hypothetical protein